MIRINRHEYIRYQIKDCWKKFTKYENIDVDELYKNKDKGLLEDIDTVFNDLKFSKVQPNDEGYMIYLDENEYTFYSDKFIENLLIESFKEFLKNNQDDIKYHE